MKRFLVCILAVFLLQSVVLGTVIEGSNEDGQKYENTWMKDFQGDAPWRIKSLDEKIPFSVTVKDSDQDGVYLQSISLYIKRSGNWQRFHYENITKKQKEIWLSQDRWVKVIKKYSARDLGIKAGEDVLFKIDLHFDEGWWWPSEHFRKVVKIHFSNNKFPSFPNWYHGDTHTHTEFTDNLYEFGASVNEMSAASSAMGLDWIFFTDHSCDFDRYGNQFKQQQDSIAKYNNISTTLLLQGEEVTIDENNVDNSPDNKIHFLAFDSDFIRGPENPLAQTDDTSSILSKLSDVLNQAKLGYAAHSFSDSENFATNISIGSLVDWTNANYNEAMGYDSFKGLELYNERGLYEKTVDTYEMNPFPFENGTYMGNEFNTFMAESMSKYGDLLLKDLNSPRKIFIAGGSDAHGDINYRTSLGVETKASDNALAKVRTAIYSPEGLTKEGVIRALERGNSVVTDGPMVIFNISSNNNTIIPGDDLLFTSDEYNNATLNINWTNSDEFGGDLQQLHLYINKSKIDLSYLLASQGQNYSLDLSDILTQLNLNLSEKYFTLRIEAFAGELFRCYTNPVWLKVGSGKSGNGVEFASLNVAPNPFNPITNISFSLSSPSKVKLMVYNSKGEIVSELINSSLSKGSYSAGFDGSYLSSGLYYCRLVTDSEVTMKKIVLMK